MKTTIIPHDTSHVLVTSSRPCAVYSGLGPRGWSFIEHEPGEVYVSMVMLETDHERDFAKDIELQVKGWFGDRVDELVIYERQATRGAKSESGEVHYWGRYGAIAYLKPHAERAS